MFKITKKVPMGVAALCVVSLFGLRDTGVLINEHVQPTYNGNKVSFAAGEKVEVLEKNENGYVVLKGKAKVTVPEEKLQVANSINVYKVTKNAAIKNENDVIRNLFMGEELTEIESKDEVLKVKASDGAIGYVAKDALELAFTTKEDIKVTEAQAKKKAEENEKIKSEDEKKIEEVAKNQNIVKVSVAQDANKAKDVQVDKAVSTNKETTVAKAVSNTNEKPIANTAVNSALDKLGSKYVYGATGNGAYDCSGLIYSVYKNELGINLPRSSREQSGYGQQVSRSDMQKGDLIFFNTTGGGVSHVGIYMGNNEFVHASSGQRKVMVSNLDENYYNSRFVNATRVL